MNTIGNPNFDLFDVDSKNIKTRKTNGYLVTKRFFTMQTRKYNPYDERTYI